VRGCDVRDLPCNSKGLVGDIGSTVRNWELVFAEKCVALPRKDGVITETAEDGVAERQEEHLQQKQQCVVIKTQLKSNNKEKQEESRISTYHHFNRQIGAQNEELN